MVPPNASGAPLPTEFEGENSIVTIPFLKSLSDWISFLYGFIFLFSLRGPFA